MCSQGLSNESVRTSLQLYLVFLTYSRTTEQTLIPMNKYLESEFLSLWNCEINTNCQKCSSANEHLERLTLRFTDAVGINGNIAASFCAIIPNCLSAVARLIVGVFFSGDFCGRKPVRNTTMININIGLNTAPPPRSILSEREAGVQDQALNLLLTFDLKLNV